MYDAFPFTSLASFPEPTLTVYLNTNPTQHLNRNEDHSCVSWFRNHGKQLLNRTDPARISELNTVLSRVDSFLEGDKSQHAGLAIFACKDALQSFPLDTEPDNELHWGKPKLWQLLAIAHDNAPSYVVQVNKAGVQLLRYRPGDLTLVQSLDFRLDDSGWKQMQGSHSADIRVGMAHGAKHDQFDRRRENQFMHFLNQTAVLIASACEAQMPIRLLLLGSERYTRYLENKFPSWLRARTSRNAHRVQRGDSSALMNTVRVEATKWEAERIDALVGELLNPELRIVTGIDETLNELQRGKLSCVAVCQNFNPGLHYCSDCRSVTASPVKQCGRCGHSVEDTSLQEILPLLLIRNSCRFEVVRGSSAQRLHSAGGIGGWLDGQSRDTRSGNNKEAHYEPSLTTMQH